MEGNTKNKLKRKNIGFYPADVGTTRPLSASPSALRNTNHSKPFISYGVHPLPTVDFVYPCMLLTTISNYVTVFIKLPKDKQIWFHPKGSLIYAKALKQIATSVHIFLIIFSSIIII